MNMRPHTTLRQAQGKQQRDRTHFYNLIPILAMIVPVGCVDPVKPVSTCPTTQPQRVHDDRSGFSIIPPEGYVSTGATRQHFLNYLGPSETGFTVNFNVCVRSDDGTEMQRAGAKASRVMSLLLRDYKLVEHQLSNIGGHASYCSSGTFTWSAKRCRNLQYFIRGGNGRLYVITFASLEESFDRHRSTFEAAAQSIQID